MTITSMCSRIAELASVRVAALVGAVLLALVLAAYGVSSSSVQISYLSFIQQIEAGNVRSISAAGRAISGTFKHPVTYPPTAHAKSVRFSTELPIFTPVRPLERLLRKERVTTTGLRHSSG